MIVHLIDGTYELFRHFYGIRRFKKSDPPFGGVAGVLHMIAGMIKDEATHIGVATDHVIESFRNTLWADYKTGEGIEPALLAQFHPLEEALRAMGVTVWAEVEFEADDALAAAANFAAQDEQVEKICIWTSDKDLSQCVVGDRVVQIDRRNNQIRDAAAVRAKFGVAPEFIPDYLALVGDAADGYPGISGCGPKTAASLINRYGPIEDFPEGVLRDTAKQKNRELALLFKTLATLRLDVPLTDNTGAALTDVEQLRWTGPTKSFDATAKMIGDERLTKRVVELERFSGNEPKLK